MTDWEIDCLVLDFQIARAKVDLHMMAVIRAQLDGLAVDLDGRPRMVK